MCLQCPAAAYQLVVGWLCGVRCLGAVNEQRLVSYSSGGACLPHLVTWRTFVCLLCIFPEIFTDAC